MHACVLLTRRRISRTPIQPQLSIVVTIRYVYLVEESLRVSSVSSVSRNSYVRPYEFNYYQWPMVVSNFAQLTKHCTDTVSKIQVCGKLGNFSTLPTDTFLDYSRFKNTPRCASTAATRNGDYVNVRSRGNDYGSKGRKSRLVSIGGSLEYAQISGLFEDIIDQYRQCIQCIRYLK